MQKPRKIQQARVIISFSLKLSALSVRCTQQRRRIIFANNCNCKLQKLYENPMEPLFIFTIPPSRRSRRPCTHDWNFPILSQDRSRTRRSNQPPSRQGSGQPNTASDRRTNPSQRRYRMIELDSYLRQFFAPVQKQRNVNVEL